jgi:hypothetical protein
MDLTTIVAQRPTAKGVRLFQASTAGNEWHYQILNEEMEITTQGFLSSEQTGILMVYLHKFVVATEQNSPLD